MRIIALLSLLFIWAHTAHAGHSRGNGQQWRAKAVEQNVQRNVEKCEEYLEEALRMIRKSGGEYPTE